MKLIEAVQCRIWLIDELQILILENHGVRLYPTWSNTSENLPTHPNALALLPSIQDKELTKIASTALSWRMLPILLMSWRFLRRERGRYSILAHEWSSRI